MQHELDQLTLVVINSEQLEAGVTPEFSFTNNRGVIGSSRLANWLLKDSKANIKERHCEIVEIDNSVCVRDLSGLTYINGSSMAIGAGEMARLQHNDEIGIGRYRIRAIFNSGFASDDSKTQLESLLRFENNILLDMGFEMESEASEQYNTQPMSDPIEMLDDVLGYSNDSELIPESGDCESKSNEWGHLLSATNSDSHDDTFASYQDNGTEISSSIYLTKTACRNKSVDPTPPNDSSGAEISHCKHFQKPNFQLNNDAYKGLPMDENELSLVEDEVTKALSKQSTERGSDEPKSSHLLTGPILEGLEAHISDSHDMKRMHFLSQEFGLSLQACIKGLLEINQQVNLNRSGSMNRKLQPIEDNPLRLGLSYEQTIATMYDKDKSLVHLSAPVAIAENLKSVCNHNEAVQHATSDALRQILHAFSPQVLLRRFYSYKRNTDVDAQSEQAWAWEMYCSYYQELVSDRQSGFEKLFWEIFDQSYDGKIREKQQEL